MLLRRRNLRWALPVLACTAVVFADHALTAQEQPLHVRIDEQLPALATASDADFLRRVSLDLIGMPPTADELRAFLADESPEKRAAAVDRLLASPQYTRRMAEFLDVTLMERRGNTHVPQDSWMAYLVESVRANKPWNQLAREILSADGTDDDPRAAVRFYLDRGAEPNLLTRDVGRIFFGRDMQCAQCHDHPLIDDYLQADYHGLFAFLAPGIELKIKEGEAEKTYYAERAGSDVQFESVFVQGIKHLTGARVPGGTEVVEPVFLPGDEYDVKPADNVRPQPKFSRRAKLAELATDGTNRAFNENIANRLWAEMMGRGLVHPVDLHHSGNPPTHPALLTMLGEQFAAMRYDIRAFVRELVLTQVYQRALDTPGDLLERSAAAAPLVTQLEQVREPLVAAAEAAMSTFNTAIEEWNTAQAALLPTVAELDAARGKYAEAVKKVDEAQAAVAAAQAQVSAKQTQVAAVTEASTKAQAAVAAVPDDAELAAAAQKFAERAAALAAEVTSLEAVVVEKTAAVAAPQAERDAARPPVEAAQATVTPLREAVRQKEAAVVEARRVMSAAVVALNNHDELLQATRTLAEVKATEDAAAAAQQLIATRQTELQSATAQSTEYAAVVTQRQSELQAAQEAQTAAEASLAAIQQEHASQAEKTQAVATALAGTNTALEKLPDDSALKTAADALAARSSELNAALAEHQKQVDAAATAQQAAATATSAAQAAMDAANTEQARLNEAVAAAQSALTDAQSQADAARGTADTARLDLIDDWSQDFTLAALQPLSPEQMCWSVFRATRVYDNYWQQHANELQAAAPLSEADLQDPAKVAARNIEIEQKTYDALKGNVAVFVTFYGAGAGQPQSDFFATADQALFAANGGSIISWIAPSGGNITERIVNEADPQKAAEDLYLTVLSRLPSPEEINDVTSYLASRPDQRAAAAQELVWGLLASAEFRFNH